jgi:hypothetical protein
MLIDIDKCVHKKELQIISNELSTIKNLITFERYKKEGLIFKWLNKSPGAVWSMGIYHINGLESLKQRWIHKNFEIENSLKFGVPMDENQVQVSLVNYKTKNFPEFDSIVHILKSMKYCNQCFINFIEPNSYVIKHTDKHLMSADKVLFYPCVIGINIPSQDEKLCAFDIGGKIKTLSNGEIYVMNGSYDHCGWNYTNDWRITMIIDMDVRAFGEN